MVKRCRYNEYVSSQGHDINVKENVFLFFCFFFSECGLKKALRDTLTRAALSGLKLANQIARLVANVVRCGFKVVYAVEFKNSSYHLFDPIVIVS